MMRRLTVLVLMTAACELAVAQHADVYVFRDGSQLGVAQYNYDLLAAVDTQVFSNRFNNAYSVNDPGFTGLSGDPALTPSASLGWDFLPMSESGYTSTLLYWDGVGDEALFGPPPTDDYRLFLFGRTGPVAAGGTDELVPGNELLVTNASGGLGHDHFFFFLDDNGDGTNATLPDAGYYLMAMQLRMEGLETSDPIFLLWGTPDSDPLTQQQTALPWVQAHIDTLVGDGLPGDFNGDGSVDAADYTVWRDDAGATLSEADYDTWATNYGATAAEAPALAVPEPASIAVLTGSLGLLTGRRRPIR